MRVQYDTPNTALLPSQPAYCPSASSQIWNLVVFFSWTGIIRPLLTPKAPGVQFSDLIMFYANMLEVETYASSVYFN